jgi:hypothetical protein
MVRSNGGVIYIEDGIVVNKWPGWKFTSEDLADAIRKDAEEITLMESVHQTLVYECSILIIFFIIILFRYVCGIIYGQKFRIIKLPKIIEKKEENEIQ